MFDVNKCRSYDLLGNLTALIDPQTHLTLTYDALSRLTAANDPDYTQSWTYDRNGNRLSQWHSGELTDYAIDPASNRLLQAGSRAYQYDANGNLINDGKHSYHYDARNRLTAVDNGQTARYTHNALGQRIHKTALHTGGSGSGPDYLALAQQAEAEAQASARQQNADALSQQAQAKTEEAAQLQQQADNLSQQAEAKQQEAQQLRAEANDHLQQANQLEQQAAECRALAEQSGTAPTTSQTTVFIYDEHGQLIGEYDEAGNARQETVWLGNLPVATVQNGHTYAVHANHLGTPRVITNSSYTEVWRWDSDPFGTTAANEDPDNDGNTFTYNLRFPGQVYDAETGLHYNYFRTYDPATGRYIESDPIGLEGGLNTYAYVGSNPLLYIDPLGLKGGCPANMYPGPGNICIPNPDDNYKNECVGTRGQVLPFAFSLLGLLYGPTTAT